jgi:hypothetical protein
MQKEPCLLAPNLFVDVIHQGLHPSTNGGLLILLQGPRDGQAVPRMELGTGVTPFGYQEGKGLALNVQASQAALHRR